MVLKCQKLYTNKLDVLKEGMINFRESIWE